jgi:predicted lipoprotein
MELKKILILCSVVSILFLQAGCKDKKNEQPQADFDRNGMLINIGNNIIIPNYQNFNSKVITMDSLLTVFNLNPSASGLINLQNAFKDAYISYETVSMLDFGPAEQEVLRVTVNIFPCDTSKINTNISTGGYNLDAASSAAATGFPALDYLLFGTGADNTEILAKLTTDSKAAERKAYLAALSNQIKAKANNVLNGWLPSGGNYINTFINASGTDMGSSVGYLVNQINYELDNLKNAKIGIPLGKQSLGVIYPEKTEGYYSGISLQLALTQVSTTQNIFLGKSGSNDGSGFDDYLTQIDASYNGGSLSLAINNQFNTAIAKLNLVPNPLSGTIQSNPATVDTAYVEIQKLLVLMKTDMPSALAVLITYVDNDGD